MVKSITYGTILSILIFISTSFLTVLFQINSPLNRIKDYHQLKIGFPFVYYHEFIVDIPIPNSEWSLKNLFLDCLITWILVIGYFVLVKHLRGAGNQY